MTDWPLDELERFKKDRPTIYGQMVTRLMKLTPDPAAEVSSVDCDRLKVLQAEGKVQQLPAACAPGDPTAARMTPAVAARSVRK